jgi:hypothetical protein
MFPLSEQQRAFYRDFAESRPSFDSAPRQWQAILPMNEYSTQPHEQRKLTLEWVQQEDGSRALVFDAATWAAFERAAAGKGQTASHMISTAVAASFGSIMMDNYTYNRFMRADDPDFLRLNRRLHDKKDH